MTTQQELNQYYGGIRKALRGTPEYRKQVLDDLKNDVQSYLEDHPEATIGDVRQNFGDAAAFSREYDATISGGEQRKNQRNRNRIFVAVVAGILAVLLLFGAGMAKIIEEQREINNGYHTQEIIEPN